MVEQPSTRPEHRNPDSDKKTFPWYGIVAMLLAAFLPVILFTEVFDNWNERHPAATVIIVTLGGFAATATLVRWAVMDNPKMVAIWTFFFLLYGLALGYAA